MGIELRFPNITAPTPEGQLSQIKSYLYQFAEQLQWALGSIEHSGDGTVVQTPKISPLPSGKEKDSVEIFNSIKALIIKSAEIADAYYEKIDRKLVGKYDALSDFGTYSEKTSQQIEENATDIERLFLNYQEISSYVEGVEDTIINVAACIRTGLIDENGSIPVYGLEIGQKNTVKGKEVFNKFARFTAERLSFYDQNDTEVAYISDRKLYIADAEISSSLKVGGFTDFVLSEGDIVTKWTRSDGDA